MLQTLGIPVVGGALAMAIVAIQVAGGALLWSALRRGTIGLGEASGMGFALGTVLATLGSQVSIAVVGTGIGWMLAPAAGLLAWLGTRARWWSSASVVKPTWRSSWLLIPAIVLGVLALLPSLLVTPLRNGYMVGGVYQPDLVFFEAVAQSLAHWGAADNSMLVGEAIRYHWLSYGWIGSLTSASGLGDFVVMTRVFPLLAVLAATVLAAAWARLMTRVWWVPGFAALLVVAGGYVGASQGVALTYDSPSTAYAVVLALAFGIVLTLALRVQRGASTGRLASALGLLSFALVGAKASQAAVVAVGIIAVCVWAVVSRSIGKVWPLALASGLGMVFGYFVFLFGVAGDETNIGVSGTQQHASTFQGLDPFDGGWGVALGTLVLLLAIIPRWLGSAWLLQRHPGEFAFSIGLVVAGAGTLVVLRSGTNAAWFALGSTALLSVLSAVGVSEALQRVGYSHVRRRWIRDPVLWAIVGAVVVNLVVLFAYALAAVSGAQVLWRGPMIAIVLSVLAGWILSRSGRLIGGSWMRAAAMVTVFLTITSLGARASGSIVWGLAHSRATPTIQEFIRVFDSNAEFPGAAPTSRHGMGLRTAAAAVPLDDRGVNDAVARRMSIIQWTPSMNDAAIVLRETSDPTDIIAVSRPNLQPFLPIVSERRTLLSGLPYSTGYTTSAGIQSADQRLNVVTEALSRPSRKSIAALSETGTTWLWITPESFDSIERLSPWTEIVVADADVVLLRLTFADANSA